MPASRPIFHRPSLFAVLTLLLIAPASMPLAQDSKPKGPPPVPVVVAAVRVVSEAPSFTYNGFMEPLEKAIISAVESGFVKKIMVREGEVVKKGAVLAELASPSLQLDLVVLRAQIQEAEALLAQANVKLVRAKELYAKKLVTEEQLENEQASYSIVEARKRVSESMADRLKSKLEMLTIRAPIAGQVISLDLELGQWITSNTQIYQISNFDRFELRIGVPGKFLNTVPEDAKVKVRIPELGQDLQGRIKAVIHHVDSNTGNFVMRIEVDNPKRSPLSGLVGHATIPVGSRKRVKVVPRDAIVRRGPLTQIVVIRNNKAELVPVEVMGNLNNGVIVIAKNLKAKEQVVVRGNERLFPGMTVEVTKE